MRSERLRELNLNLLVTLDAILDHGNLTKAAAELDVTQGAISQSLARLRSFFNDELLIKVGNTMQPTALGTQVREPVADVLASVESCILVQRNFNPAVARGQLNICMTDLGEFTFLGNLLNALGREAPNLTVRTRALPDNNLAELMAGGQIDLAFAGPIDDYADLKVQKIFEHDLVALVSADNTLPDVISPEDYVSMPHIVLESPYIKRVRLERTLASFGLERIVAVRTPHVLVQPGLLEQNPRLVATLPRGLAEKMARMLPLRVLNFGFPVPRPEVFQYWHPRFNKHGMSCWLRQLVADLAHEMTVNDRIH